MIDYRRAFFCLALSMLVMSCEKPPSKASLTTQSYTVQPISLPKTLRFTGIIQPRRESSLTCPINAVIESMPYHYGQFVPKSEVIFTLSSSELQNQYNDILTDYLKAKDAYSVARTKFIGTEELWQAGLISKNNYLNEKSSLNTLRLGLIQASHKLSEIMEKVGSNSKENLSQLSFAEFDKVRMALHNKHNLIHLRAPRGGILLYPPKESTTRSHSLGVGSGVKAGQVVALMGDLSGIRVEIDIPEVDISTIKIGMPATVRGLALGNHVLKGKLIAINAQASLQNHDALPSFNAVVEVDSLTPEERSLIKVGMSATIELTIAQENKLFIPIAAIKQTSGQSMVQVRHQNGQVKWHRVTPGVINTDQVAIDEGLNIGDTVLYG